MIMSTTETVPKTAMQVILDMYDMHSKLFHNVIEGIAEKDANNRLNTKANHPSWIAGSLVQDRFELAAMLGEKRKSDNDELFQNHRSRQDGVQYPALDSYKKNWDEITPVLRNILANIKDEVLESIAPIDMGGEKYSWYEMIYFTIDREAYCIGQLALFRRLLGYEAMKYS
jgi:hypothetical protein